MPIDRTPSPVTFRIDAEIQKRIEAYARAVGASPSEVVRRAFEEYEKLHDATRPEEASVFDVLSRAGIIGCVKDQSVVATDLATNPEHMDGFGRD